MPQQPVALIGDLVAEAPRTTGGLVALGKVATALDWQPSDLVSYRLFPDRRAVVLRPSDTALADEPWQTVSPLDQGETYIDAKRRLRLPPPLLMSLGVRATGDQLLAWGFRRVGLRKWAGATRTGGATPWVVLLMHPAAAMPVGWDEWVQW